MRGRYSLADRFCENIKELTAERQTRTYAALFVPSVREPAAQCQPDLWLDKSFPAVGAKAVSTTVMHNCRLNKALSMAQLATKVTK